jgi:hypothetical protein
VNLGVQKGLAVPAPVKCTSHITIKRQEHHLIWMFSSGKKLASYLKKICYFISKRGSNFLLLEISSEFIYY